jgi:proline iminopeptidase
MPRINIGDIKLYFEIYGSELILDGENAIQKPTLIVLHGGPGTTDHTMYVEFWSQFSDIAQVIFIDQRGNGRSDYGNPDLWNLGQCGKDIDSFCQALEITKPFVAGVSWGGYVAMSYATQFPTKSGGLIFCNTEAEVSPDARSSAFRKIVGEEAAHAAKQFDTSCGSVEATQAYLKHCLPHFAKNSYNPTEIARCKKNPAMRQKFLIDENLSFNYLHSLHVVQCPTLIIAGESDPAHPMECAEKTAKCIPPHLLEFHKVSEAGAPIYKDQPEKCKALINKFLLKNKPSIY